MHSDFLCCDIQALFSRFPELSKGQGLPQRRKLASVGHGSSSTRVTATFEQGCVAECPCAQLAVGQEGCYPALRTSGEVRPGDLSRVTEQDLRLWIWAGTGSEHCSPSTFLLGVLRERGMKKGRLRKAVAEAGTFLGTVTIEQERGETGHMELKWNSERLDSASSSISASVQPSPTCPG